MGIHNIKYSVIQRTQFKYNQINEQDWTLYVVIDGAFWARQAEKEELVGRGDLYFIPPNEPIFRNVTEPLKVHFFRFDVDATDAIQNEIPHGKISLRDDARLQSSLRMLKSLPSLSGDEQSAFLHHILSDILFQCRFEKNVPKQTPYSDPLVSEVIGYFKEHYMQKINMRLVAERFGISPSGLILKFRRATGMLPAQHLMAIRLTHVKRLLVDTSLPLSRIAEQTGFDNCYYFSNVFKKEIGISPSEYRRSYVL